MIIFFYKIVRKFKKWNKRNTIYYSVYNYQSNGSNHFYNFCYSVYQKIDNKNWKWNLSKNKNCFFLYSNDSNIIENEEVEVYKTKNKKSRI